MMWRRGCLVGDAVVISEEKPQGEPVLAVRDDAPGPNEGTHQAHIHGEEAGAAASVALVNPGPTARGPSGNVHASELQPAAAARSTVASTSFRPRAAGPRAAEREPPTKSPGAKSHSTKSPRTLTYRAKNRLSTDSARPMLRRRQLCSVMLPPTWSRSQATTAPCWEGGWAAGRGTSQGHGRTARASHAGLLRTESRMARNSIAL